MHHPSPVLHTDTLIITVYKWSFAGTISKNIARQSNIWGLVCLIALDFVFLFSTSFWRTKSYNFFLTTHFIGFVVLIPSVSPDLLYGTLYQRGTELDLQTLPRGSLFHHRSLDPLWPGLHIPLLQVTFRHRHHPTHTLTLFDVDRDSLS